MKVITLAEDTIVEGQLCRKGQLVQVEDGFDTNVKRVVAEPREIERKIKGESRKVKDLEEEQKVKGERLRKDLEEKEKGKKVEAEAEAEVKVEVEKKVKEKNNGKAK